MGSILVLGIYPGVGNDNPTPCSCLGGSMERRAWRVTVHGVPKSQMRVSTHTPMRMIPPFAHI